MSKGMYSTEMFEYYLKQKITYFDGIIQLIYQKLSGYGCFLTAILYLKYKYHYLFAYSKFVDRSLNV